MTTIQHRPDTQTAVAACDHFPRLREEIIAGLSVSPRTLPCKLFYDQRGSELFEQICNLPEYYPTRTETAITQAHIHAITRALGPDITLIELGSGSSTKTRLLLNHLDSPASYVPMDISADHLHRIAVKLRRRYPDLPIYPLAADYCQPFKLPEAVESAGRRVVYFPGSTIGNFHPDEAAAFIEQLAEIAGVGGAVLIGVDLCKDPARLLPAYDDASGVTAAFNRNLLVRLRDEFGARVDVEGFAHNALWNAEHGRVEMHLISLYDQIIELAGRQFRFTPGETIWTESSYKHTLADFASLCRGMKRQAVWVDEHQLFSVQLWRVV